MTVLHTLELTRKYGRLTAVDHLDLNIRRGQVFGLLGPNGSGKTTTLGMVLGVTRPTSGSFEWFDKPNDHTVRRNIGAILEQPVFYPHLSARQNLRISARIKKCDERRIPEVLEFVGLTDRSRDAFKTYSLGMKQRLAIASALVADPQVLILDEPTNGLDPEGIHDVRGLIQRIASEGKTIVLASHLLDEVQKVCTEYAVLRKGQCIHQGNVALDLESSGGWEVAAEDGDALETELRSMNNVRQIVPTDTGFHVDFKTEMEGQDINRHFMERGISLAHLARVRNTLEEKFLELLKQKP